MKSLLFTPLLIFFQYSYGQLRTNCEVLKEIFTKPEAKIFVKLRDSSLDIPIVFVDTASFFQNCMIEPINGRKVYMVHDSLYVNQINRSNIIIYAFYEKENVYKLEFYSKRTHAHCSAIIKNRRNRFILLKTRFGILD